MLARPVHSTRARWRTTCLNDRLYPWSPNSIATHRQNVNKLKGRGLAAALLVSPLVVGCSSAKPAEKPAPVVADHVVPDHQHMGGMSMPVTIPKGALYTEADVRFMQGMIAHHAQAIYMSRMAAVHGANPRLHKFANKI